jgi:DNA invertase Pin-like site-specific DNA recombinase
MSAPARPPYAHSARRLAEFERELIHPRTGEGRKRAKERGVRFGRPRKLTRANHRLAQPVTRAANK